MTKRHKWSPQNICVTCGLHKGRKTIKQRMAMVGSRDIYKYSTVTIYWRDDEPESNTAGDCKVI